MPLAEMVRRGLAAEGYAVQVTHDGSRGLAAAGSGRHDVVVLDIMLPGLSGYRVLERMRARRQLDAGAHAHRQGRRVRRGRRASTSAPTTTWSSRSRSSSCWPACAPCSAAAVPRAPGVLQVGDLRLDPARHRVSRGDTEITLTPREFGVLEHLMRHAGEVVTKTDILRAVWDAHYEGEANVVEVYVGYLRRKIDAPFGTSSIETLRGVGYRMADPTPAWPAGHRRQARQPPGRGSRGGWAADGRDRAHGSSDGARRAAAAAPGTAPRPAGCRRRPRCRRAPRRPPRRSRAPAPRRRPRGPGRRRGGRTARTRAPAASGGTPGPSSATSSAASPPERPHRHHHRRAGVPAGVVDEVAHDLGELPAVADDPHVRGLDPRDDPACGPQPLRLAHLVEVDVLEPRPQAALVGAGQQQQRVDQPAQPRGLAAQGGDVRRRRRSAAVRAPAAPGRSRSSASGLRSSWLASATNRRCTACAACSRASIAFMVSARPADLVAGRGHRDPDREVVRVVATRARIASTGPQRPPRGEVGDDPGDQHQQRDPDQHQVEDGVDGLVHVLERLCGVDDEVATLHRRPVGDDHDLLGRLGIGLLDPVAVGHPRVRIDLGVARARAAPTPSASSSTAGSRRRGPRCRGRRRRRSRRDHLDEVAALGGGVDGVLLDVVLEVRRDPLGHDLGLLLRGLLSELRSSRSVSRTSAAPASSSTTATERAAAREVTTRTPSRARSQPRAPDTWRGYPRGPRPG